MFDSYHSNTIATFSSPSHNEEVWSGSQVPPILFYPGGILEKSKVKKEKTNDSHTADGPHSQCLPTLDMVALLACDISENCQLYVLHAMPKESAHTLLKPKLLPAPQILDMCVWLDLLSILIQMASSLNPWILKKASCGAPGDITATNNCQPELKHGKYGYTHLLQVQLV